MLNLPPTFLKLLFHFREIVDLKDEDFKALYPHLIVKKYKKKEFILKEGQVARHMTFIVKGATHAYFTDDSGKCYTSMFAIENWWINDLYSYIKEVPSKLFIQTTEETTVLQISKSNLELLFQSTPNLAEFWRLKIQIAYCATLERHHLYAKVDAYSRYQHFIENHSGIEKRFPQFMIASYLGITVEYLSFLRKKSLTKNKIS
jgi:CRP/FNR family transcriptional regulator